MISFPLLGIFQNSIPDSALLVVSKGEAFLAYGLVFVFYLSILLLIIYSLTPLGQVRKAAKGKDGVLQWDEYIEWVKVVIMIVSFVGFLTKTTVDTVMMYSIEIWVYVMFVAVFTGSIYAIDKDKLIDLINRK